MTTLETESFEGVLTFLLLNKNLLEDEANTQKSRTRNGDSEFSWQSLKCLAFVSGMPGTQWVLGCIFCEVTFSDQHMRTPRSWFLKYGTEHNLFNPLLPFIQSLNIYYVAGETTWSHVIVYGEQSIRNIHSILQAIKEATLPLWKRIPCKDGRYKPSGGYAGWVQGYHGDQGGLFFCLPFSCEGWLCRQCVLLVTFSLYSLERSLSCLRLKVDGP